MLYHHTMVIKEWRVAARYIFCRTTLSWRHINGMRCKHRKQNDCLMFIHSYYASRSHGHIHISKDTLSIFPATLQSMLLKNTMVEDCTIEKSKTSIALAIDQTCCSTEQHRWPNTLWQSFIYPVLDYTILYRRFQKSASS